MGNNNGESQRLISRIGEEKYNNDGCLMKLVKYNNANNIVVEFQDENRLIIHGAYKEFKNGSIKNPYFRGIANVACVGKTSTRINGIPKSSYNLWTNMIKRCYDTKAQEKQPTYIGCSVCEEWLIFENFDNWYNENYYELKNEVMNLDKDILVKGNRIYSPNTCVFVPQSINKLFLKRDSTRGKYPMGVSFHKRDNVYEAHCSIGTSVSKYLGRYNNEIDAFYSYKKFKESRIKEIADNYKDKIPQNLYKAMYNYVIDIND